MSRPFRRGQLLKRLAKAVLGSALEGGTTGRLRCDRRDPAGEDGGNSRNSTRSRAVLTDIRPVGIGNPAIGKAPSSRPSIVRKRRHLTITAFALVPLAP